MGDLHTGPWTWAPHCPARQWATGEDMWSCSGSSAPPKTQGYVDYCLGTDTGIPCANSRPLSQVPLLGLQAGRVLPRWLCDLTNIYWLVLSLLTEGCDRNRSRPPIVRKMRDSGPGRQFRDHWRHIHVEGWAQMLLPFHSML